MNFQIIYSLYKTGKKMWNKLEWAYQSNLLTLNIAIICLYLLFPFILLLYFRSLKSSLKFYGTKHNLNFLTGLGNVNLILSFQIKRLF